MPDGVGGGAVSVWAEVAGAAGPAADVVGAEWRVEEFVGISDVSLLGRADAVEDEPLDDVPFDDVPLDDELFDDEER